MRKNLRRLLTITTTLGIAFAIWSATFTSDSFFGNLAAKANGYYIEIADGSPYTQNWTDITKINVDNNWTEIVAIEGFSGAGLAPVAGTDPRTVLADNAAGTRIVDANETNPATSTADGVAEFEITNPTVALKGSDTAQAPNLVIHVNTSNGCQGKAVNVSFDARDIDASANNAISPLAVQYRIGGSGNYSNVAFAYRADVTTGPNQASLVTPYYATLPNAATGVTLLDIRILTTNAVGTDEWIGIDNINVNCTRVTAGDSSISGRTLTARGLGIANAVVTATNASTQEIHTAISDENGDFVLTGMEVGEIYLVNVRHKLYKFSTDPKVVQLIEDVEGLTFTAASTEIPRIIRRVPKGEIY